MSRNLWLTTTIYTSTWTAHYFYKLIIAFTSFYHIKNLFCICSATCYSYFYCETVSNLICSFFYTFHTTNFFIIY